MNPYSSRMSNRLDRIKIKKRQQCQCGCGTIAAWSRLRPLRGPDLMSYFVLDECREDFAAELDAKFKLREIFENVRGLRCNRRWPFAKLVFVLTYVALHRVHGEQRSRYLARRSMITFCLPNWITKIYGAIKNHGR